MIELSNNISGVVVYVCFVANPWGKNPTKINRFAPTIPNSAVGVASAVYNMNPNII